MEVSLIMFKSDGTRRDFPLKREKIVIGRTNEADLRIPLPSVSRKHCEFEFDGQTVVMRDLGSSNGTLHNNTRVDQALLVAGDRVDVGPVSFYIVIDGQPENLDHVRSQESAPTLDAASEEPTIIEEELVESTSAQVEALTPAVTAEMPEDPAGEQDIEAALHHVANGPPSPPKKADPTAKTGQDEFDDPIAALEALAASENESASNISAFFVDDESTSTKNTDKS